MNLRAAHSGIQLARTALHGIRLGLYEFNGVITSPQQVIKQRFYYAKLSVELSSTNATVNQAALRGKGGERIFQRGP